jgi:hypothetical protein
MRNLTVVVSERWNKDGLNRKMTQHAWKVGENHRIVVGRRILVKRGQY